MPVVRCESLVKTFRVPVRRAGLLGRADPLGSPAWLHWCSPLAGPLFLAAALKLWHLGQRRYASTGS